MADRKVLNQGIVYMAWALPLMFLGPSVMHNALINKQNPWHYLVLAIGIAIAGASVYLAYKGLNTIMKSLFGK